MTLELDAVTVGYRDASGWTHPVRDVTLRIERGQTYGLVGESGSGKTTLAMAALRYLPRNAALRGGTVRLGGEDVYAYGHAQLREMWRRKVKLVPQDPLPSLNPSHTVGRQLREALRARHPEAGSARRRALELLEAVGLPDPKRVAASHAHELSGGMQQRVMIAMALGGEPELLVLDEPTTNLDVTTEADVLDLVRDLVRESGTAVLYVSHSLGVVARVCDRVAVLYAGELVEDAPVTELYRRPLHPYTQGLFDSVPKLGEHKARVALHPIRGRIPEVRELTDACIFAPRCPVAVDACVRERPPLEGPGPGRSARCIRWREIADGTLDPSRKAPRESTSAGADGGTRGESARGAPDGRPALELRALEKTFTQRTLLDRLLRRSGATIRAVDGVDLAVPEGATVGLVGESGSGKSTLARAVLGLHEATSGEILLLDVPLAPAVSGREADVLKRLQMVFQSSDEALNPFRTVGQTLRRPFMRLVGLDRTSADEKVRLLLERVKLGADYVDRRPDQLSGGEKQRVAIARAFASQPDVLVLDESVSGLDVSVQAAIVNLLSDLQTDTGVSYLFISHDLAAVAYLADRIAVIYLGHLMETGPTRAVLEPPYHPYTEALLSAVPLLDPEGESAGIRLRGQVPSPADVPSGCRFHTRCPRFLGDVCVEQEPPWRKDERGVRIYCHIPLEELTEKQRPAFAFRTEGQGRRAGDASASAPEKEGPP